MFEIYDAETEQSIELKQETAAEFQKDLDLYFEQNFTEAQKLFSKICEINSQDKLAAIYCQRSLKVRIQVKNSSLRAKKYGNVVRWAKNQSYQQH